MQRLKKFLAVNVSAVLLTSFVFSGVSFAQISETEPNNTMATASVIPTGYNLNETIPAGINLAGDVDYYKFTPVNSGGYTIESLGMTDTFGYLYDANGDLLDKSDNQSNSNYNFKLCYDLVAFKTYYIKVTHKDPTAIGLYSLKISPASSANSEIELNNSFETAQALSTSNFEKPFTASIGKSGDEDYFSFTPTQSGTYSIESLGSIDPCAYLYNSDQTQVLFEDDISDVNRNFKITLQLNANQKYYIKIKHYYNTQIGSYSIRITPPQSQITADAEGNTMATAKALTGYFANENAQINYSTDVDFFKFTAPETGYYTFEGHGFTDTYAELYYNNNMIASDDNSGTVYNFNTSVYLEANNSYYLKVQAKNYAIGSYSFVIFRGKKLNVNIYNQQPYSNLCWATSTSMIISYFNRDKIDRKLDIAKANAQAACQNQQAVYGNDYYKYSTVFNIPEYISKCQAPITTYVSPAPVMRVEEGADQRLSSNFSVDYDRFAKNIDNSYPVLFWIANPAGGGHAVVCTGYIKSNTGFSFIYNDPLYGKEYSCDCGNNINYSSLGLETKDVCFLGYMDFIPYRDIDLESNDKSTLAASITLPGVGGVTQINGSIGIKGDVDWYKLNSYPNSQIIIETTGSTDTTGELYDSNLNLVVSKVDGGQGSNFKIARHLEPYQDYYLKVSHGSTTGTGSYTLNASYIAP